MKKLSLLTLVLLLISSTSLKAAQELTVNLPKTWAGRVDAGTPVNIYATVKGGTYPYQYTWTNAKNEVISTDSVLNITPTIVSQYYLRVTDATSKTNDKRTLLYVNSPQAVATFEDLYLDPESYWRGPEGNTDEDMESVFCSGSYVFSNTYYPDWYYWGGFGYSNITATDFDPDEFEEEQFRSVVGHGVDNSPTFGIVYTMGARTDIFVGNTSEGAIIPGTFLTNAAYTYNSIMNGDYYVDSPFEQGDYFKIIFKGTLKSGKTSTLEYYLADYRSTDASEHYALTDWKWFDLSPLGQVTQVRITTDGSRRNAGGLTTPAYACLDNFGSKAPNTVNIEANQVSSFLIYPTLATDVINIQTDKTAYSVNIFSTNGQVVYNGYSSKQVDVSGFANGVYILELVSQEGKEIKKFIKK